MSDEAGRMRELILAGCLPERRDEAKALLKRYPFQLSPLPPDRAGEGGDCGVVLDPSKLATPPVWGPAFSTERRNQDGHGSRWVTKR